MCTLKTTLKKSWKAMNDTKLPNQGAGLPMVPVKCKTPFCISLLLSGRGAVAIQTAKIITVCSLLESACTAYIWYWSNSSIWVSTSQKRCCKITGIPFSSFSTLSAQFLVLPQQQHTQSGCGGNKIFFIFINCMFDSFQVPWLKCYGHVKPNKMNWMKSRYILVYCLFWQINETVHV